MVAVLLFAGAMLTFQPSASKFDAMLASLQIPSPALTFVESSAQRTLLRGSAAVADDPKVRRAVQILYEDLRLFRPAGNALANRLASCARSANDLYSGLGTDLYDKVLPRLRGLFDAIDSDGDGELDPDEIIAAATRPEGRWPPGVAAQLCLDANDGCALAYTFSDFVELVAPAQPADVPRLVYSGAAAGSVKQAEAPVADGWGGRFDRMAEEFLSWEDEASGAWKGRTGEIVAGCFAGARSPALVGALRLVYTDNAVLRSAGDLIFRMLRPPSSRRA
jgi:hypothetical protein